MAFAFVGQPHRSSVARTELHLELCTCEMDIAPSILNKCLAHDGKQIRAKRFDVA